MIYYWVFFLVIVLKNLMVVHSDETFPFRLDMASVARGYNKIRGTKGVGDFGGLFNKNSNDRDFMMWARLNNIPKEWIPHLKVMRRMEMFGGNGFPIRKDVERTSGTGTKSLDFTTTITYNPTNDTITEETATDDLQTNIYEADDIGYNSEDPHEVVSYQLMPDENTPNSKLDVQLPNNDVNTRKKLEKDLTDAGWNIISSKSVERERHSRIRRICIFFAACGTLLIILGVFLVRRRIKEKRKFQRANYVANEGMPGSNLDASRAGFSIYMLAAGQSEKQKSRGREEVNSLPLVQNYSLSQPFIVPVAQPINVQSAPPSYKP